MSKINQPIKAEYNGKEDVFTKQLTELNNDKENFTTQLIELKQDMATLQSKYQSYIISKIKEKEKIMKLIQNLKLGTESISSVKTAVEQLDHTTSQPTSSQPNIDSN
ncbi:MAG: hypothetical protein HC836_44905 [Richelia sp. RM2_1_2]|nr:hypothetical protein [Richelia sp. RM2_1_2]